MNKLEALLKLASLVEDGAPADQPPEIVDGYAIVIADRGHSWVGEVEVTTDWVTITDARAIRRWGTSSGLNQLANEGPQAETKLDAAATVRVSRRAVIGLVPTEVCKWS